MAFRRLSPLRSITVSACAHAGIGSVLTMSGPTSWFHFTFTYIATSTTPTLEFVFDADPHDSNYLDDVSVVNNNAPSVELLSNPSFESSTSTPPANWATAGSSSCNGGTSGSVVNSGCHSSSGNNCWEDSCKHGYEYLTQSFAATIGSSYTVSFWLQQTGGSSGCFYFDII